MIGCLFSLGMDGGDYVVCLFFSFVIYGMVGGWNEASETK